MNKNGHPNLDICDIAVGPEPNRIGIDVVVVVVVIVDKQISTVFSRCFFFSFLCFVSRTRHNNNNICIHRTALLFVYVYVCSNDYHIFLYT